MNTTLVRQDAVPSGPLPASEWLAVSTPTWWKGSPERYRHLATLHSRLAALETVPLLACRLGLAGTLLGLIGAVNAGLAHCELVGAVSSRDCGLIGLACLVLSFISAWTYSLALIYRGNNAELCAALWDCLVSAVRGGLVSVDAARADIPGEAAAEGALRRELLTAIRFLEAGGGLRPRLCTYSRDIFGLRHVGQGGLRQQG